MTRLSAVLIAIAACTDVEQGVDYALPSDLQLGHRWECHLELQLGYPTPVSFVEYEYHPCRAPGPIDPFLDWWVKDVCWPDAQAADAKGEAPGGWNCGGDGCDPKNFEICEVDTST